MKLNLLNGGSPEKSFFVEKITWFFLLLLLLICLGIYLIINLYVRNLIAATPALLLAGATLFLGGFIGFLFAIPRKISSSDVSLSSTSKYMGNDNLVQISDWLTKIIVGIGLTKLYKIPTYLNNLAQHLDIQYPYPNKITVIETIILYFTITGFILAYLWTRLYFGKLLDKAEE